MSKLGNVDRTGTTAGAQGRPRRKLRSDSIRTRRAILDATLRILRDHGLAELTHRAVAKEAGVSLALTSYHFSTKDNLISEALDLAATGTTEWLEQAAVDLTAGRSKLTPQLVAARLGDLTMGRLGDEQLAPVSVIELSLAAARRPALQKVTAEWNNSYHAIVVDLLARCGIPDPAGAAVVVVGMLEGLVFLQIAESNPDFEYGVLRPALRRLLGSLGSAG
jgi:DNA-binding transcriptional regulator YbjK